jgi:nucleotide-binding universal stress UspA family protein
MNDVAITRVLVPVALMDAEEDPSAETVSAGDHDVAVATPTIDSLELATRILGKGGEIRLLHATPAFDQGRVYAGAARQRVLGNALEDVQREANASSELALKAIAERWCSGQKTSVVARPGNSVALILDEARSFGAEMIVIATSSRGAVARFFLGSTADRVIREASCPVLIIPAGR